MSAWLQEEGSSLVEWPLGVVSPCPHDARRVQALGTTSVLVVYCREYGLRAHLCFFVNVRLGMHRRWHTVATWRWDVNDERCGICYTAFEACCPDCSLPGDDCPPGEHCPASCGAVGWRWCWEGALRRACLSYPPARVMGDRGDGDHPCSSVHLGMICYT